MTVWPNSPSSWLGRSSCTVGRGFNWPERDCIFFKKLRIAVSITSLADEEVEKVWVGPSMTKAHGGVPREAVVCEENRGLLSEVPIDYF